MNGEGFRNSSSMVASISLWANLDSLLAGLPQGVKLMLAAVFAALGNLAIEYLRARAAEQRQKRELLEAQLEPARASVPPSSGGAP